MNRSVIGSLTAVVLLCAATLACADGDPERGQELYLAHGCYSCHGYDGIGPPPTRRVDNIGQELAKPVGDSGWCIATGHSRLPACAPFRSLY